MLCQHKNLFQLSQKLVVGVVRAVKSWSLILFNYNKRCVNTKSPSLIFFKFKKFYNGSFKCFSNNKFSSQKTSEYNTEKVRLEGPAMAKNHPNKKISWPNRR